MKRLLIFELNSQTSDTPPFHAPEATCLLAGIAYGLVPATLFPILELGLGTNRAFFSTHTQNGQLEYREEKCAKSDQKKVSWIRITDWDFKDDAWVKYVPPLPTTEQLLFYSGEIYLFLNHTLYLHSSLHHDHYFSSRSIFSSRFTGVWKKQYSLLMWGLTSLFPC